MATPNSEPAVTAKRIEAGYLAACGAIVERLGSIDVASDACGALGRALLTAMDGEQFDVCVIALVAMLVRVLDQCTPEERVH